MWDRVSEESVESERALSCWLVLPAARKRRERKTGQVCPARKACVDEGERMLPRLFIDARGSDPGRMAWNILIGRKYEIRTKTVKIFLRQTIIWNSFCYNPNIKNKQLVSEVRKWYFIKFILLTTFVLEFWFFWTDSLVPESMDEPKLKLALWKSRNNWLTSILYSNAKTVTRIS